MAEWGAEEQKPEGFNMFLDFRVEFQRRFKSLEPVVKPDPAPGKKHVPGIGVENLIGKNHLEFDAGGPCLRGGGGHLPCFDNIGVVRRSQLGYY